MTQLGLLLDGLAHSLTALAFLSELAFGSYAVATRGIIKAEIEIDDLVLDVSNRYQASTQRLATVTGINGRFLNVLCLNGNQVIWNLEKMVVVRVPKSNITANINQQKLEWKPPTH